MLKFLRTPQLVLLGTIQGAMFLLIFRYVFGGAISVGGISYVDFLVPGFVTTGVLFGGMGAATAIAEDMEGGFVDRLRSLPIPRSAVLSGRAIADTAILVWSLVITTGDRVPGGVPPARHGLAQALLAFVLCLVYGFAFEWVFIALGMFAGNAQAAQGIAFMVFPLTFVSSAYVPVASMPSWLQGFAREPADHRDGQRRPDAHAGAGRGGAARPHSGLLRVKSLLWSAAIVAVFAPLAVARFRRG